MKKRFFLALSIVFLGLSVLSDSADAGQFSSEIVACSVYGNNACWYLGTDGKIHNTDWTVNNDPGINITGMVHFGYWASFNTGTGYLNVNTPEFFAGASNGNAVNNWYAGAITFLTPSGEAWDSNRSWDGISARIYNSPSGIKDFSPASGWNTLEYVLSDWTSNSCPWSDNAKVWAIAPTQGWKPNTICQKNDGSYYTDIPGLTIPNNSVVYSPLYDDNSGNQYVCWINQDKTMGCFWMTAPAGTWRDIGMANWNYACGVDYATNLVKCWNNSGTIISTSSTESGGQPIPPPTPGTGFAKAGMSCVADRYPKISSTSWIDPGFMNWQGTFTQTTYTGKSPYGCTGWLGNDCGDIIYGIGKSTDGVAVDYIKLYNFDAESVIRADSWKPPTVAVWPRSTLIADYHEPQILQIQAVRNGENYSANVYEFSNVANPSSVEPWANYFDDATKKWLPVYASGGIAKIPLSNGQTKLFLSLREFTVPPIGFRMGYSAEYYDQVSCSTPTNPCKMTLVGANWECRGGYANGYYGQCAYDTDGACSPIVSTGGTVSDGVPEEGAIVIKDSNGNVVSVRPKGSAIQDGGGIDANKVFSCPEYKGFLDIFPCAVTIGGNVVELISQSVTGADGNGGIQKIGTDIGSGATATGGVSLTPVNADSDNLADYMFRHSWNRATDSDLATPFTNWGKFALYGALFVALLGVLATIAFVNRNR